MALKYVLVNIKYEAIGVDCACCKKPIKKTFVRDLETFLYYHNPWCYEAHVAASIKAIQGQTHAEFYR